MNAVDVLNAAFAADPAAIRALMINRVPCNKSLADDPFVEVAVDPNITGKHFTVGALGLINGVLAAHGLPLVAGKWVMNTEGSAPHKFVGFCEYVPVTQGVTDDDADSPAE